jgi:hypothetical protein
MVSRALSDPADVGVGPDTPGAAVFGPPSHAVSLGAPVPAWPAHSAFSSTRTGSRS